VRIIARQGEGMGGKTALVVFILGARFIGVALRRDEANLSSPLNLINLNS